MEGLHCLVLTICIPEMFTLLYTQQALVAKLKHKVTFSELYHTLCSGEFQSRPGHLLIFPNLFLTEDGNSQGRVV